MNRDKKSVHLFSCLCLQCVTQLLSSPSCSVWEDSKLFCRLAVVYSRFLKKKKEESNIM